MVEVHVADGDVLDVVRGQVDLLELGVDRDVRCADDLQSLGHGTPVARVVDELVVVAGVEQEIALGMHHHEEPDRNLHLGARGAEASPWRSRSASSPARAVTTAASRSMKPRKPRSSASTRCGWKSITRSPTITGPRRCPCWPATPPARRG